MRCGSGGVWGECEREEKGNERGKKWEEAGEKIETQRQA